jgi:hypothetical protein
MEETIEWHHDFISSSYLARPNRQLSRCCFFAAPTA